MKVNQFSRIVLVSSALSAGAGGTWAQEAAEQAPAVPDGTAMMQPAMVGPLTANPDPAKFAAGPLGDLYVTGVLSGFGQWQSGAVPGDRRGQADLSNGQIVLQTTEGPVQFYVQAGAYSLPALGTPYLRAGKAIDDFYGAVPVAFAKLAPSDAFNVIAGKIPTLIGAEYTFTFENMNIDRGLLWNQENAVSRGLQANYAAGPLALSLAWTDGFYSDHMTWVSGSAAYAIDAANSVSLIGGANLDQTSVSTLATPLAQNNSEIYNLIYTYSSDPWTVTPYLQYSLVPKNLSLGIAQAASTLGGAILAKYAFAAQSGLEGITLPVRFEYIASSGNASDGAPNLLYGPGSSAWSLTLSPTYQKGVFFARTEASYVRTQGSVSGMAFGSSGTSQAQWRLAVETGVLF